MAVVLVAPPAVQPVSLLQVKEYLKVETSDDDQLIADMIDQAVSYIENISDHKLITQSWRVFFYGLPENRVLELPLSPVIAPIEVRFYNTQGDSHILAGDDYELDAYSSPARLWIKPALSLGTKLNGLEVDLKIGFGDSGANVPGNIIRAIMVTIAHWYEFRGAVHPADQPVSTPAGLNKLLAPYLKVKL